MSPDKTMARDRAGQRTSWDLVAASLPPFFDAASTRYYRQCEIALLKRQIGDLRGLRVLKLDLWNEAMNTRILHWMEEQGAEVWGLDHSGIVAARAVRTSRDGGSRARLMRADIRELPFASRSFDFVYTMGTIEHIDEYRAAVAEIHRVLKPGGRTIVGVPHKWNLFLRPLMVAILTAMGKYLYAPEKSFGARELRRLLQQCGLRVSCRTGILTLPGPLRMLDLWLHTRRHPLENAMPWLIAPFGVLETRYSWPGHFGYLLAMVAERPDPNAG